MTVTKVETLIEVHQGRDGLREHRQIVSLALLKKRLDALDSASSVYAKAV